MDTRRMIGSPTQHDAILAVLGASGIVAASGAIAVAVITYSLNATSARRIQKRERYAQITTTLVCLAELPYRIRRRTSNDQACLAALVDQIHTLQERLVCESALLWSECRWLAEKRDTAQRIIQSANREWVEDAWKLPPIATTAAFNLGNWGPKGLGDIVNDFATVLRWRFGWRWWINPLHRLVHRSSADLP
jgi:hypothetical protein